MEKLIINTSYDEFSVSHAAFVRLRESGQREALQQIDRGAYWPAAAGPWEPSLNQSGKLIPRADEKLIGVVEELREAANGHAGQPKIVSIPDEVQWVIIKTDSGEQVGEAHRMWN